MNNNSALFFTGIGIGIFMGLSKSEILLQILVPILTIIVGLIAILTGQKSFEKDIDSETQIDKLKNINAFPLMWMILGMVVGSAIGIPARTYQIFTPKELKSKVYEQEGSNVYGTILHNLSSEECSKLRICELEGIELLCELKYVENPEVERLLLDMNEINLDSITSTTHLICECNN